MKTKTNKKSTSKKDVENVGERITDLEIVKNQLARVLADYDNLRKRYEGERLEICKLTSIGVISKFLPVLDNLRVAQEHIKDSGIAIIVGEFEQTLKDEGLEEITSKRGDNFDNDAHEVVEVEKTKKIENNGKVSEMVLSGWKITGLPLQTGSQIVRHVKVKVYKHE